MGQLDSQLVYTAPPYLVGFPAHHLELPHHHLELLRGQPVLAVVVLLQPVFILVVQVVLYEIRIRGAERGA